MNGPQNSENIGNSSADAERKHSQFFGPSASHSWIHCPFSAIIRGSMPDTSSIYADKGTLAHELCEIKVKLYFNQITKEEYEERLKTIQANPLYESTMQSSTDEYLEAIKELSLTHFNIEPICYVEQLIKYDDLCGDDGFGTSDCILLGGDTLGVIDYKNGTGVYVSAKGNSQMRLYAYGALRTIVDPMFYRIQKIVMCIAQPNLNNISAEVISVDELFAWVDAEVKPAVQKIQDGCKDRVPGWWCKDSFCPNFATCRAWREKFASVYADYEIDYSELDFDTITPDELGAIYTKAAELRSWIDKVEKKVESFLKKHKDVQGWKLVEGRSNRVLTDADKAYEVLSKESGVDINMFYSKVPITLTAATKLVGKKTFDAVCAPYLSKPPGKPTVVPASDPRKPINSAESDFADLERSSEDEGANDS